MYQGTKCCRRRVYTNIPSYEVLHEGANICTKVRSRGAACMRRVLTSLPRYEVLHAGANIYTYQMQGTKCCMSYASIMHTEVAISTRY